MATIEEMRKSRTGQKALPARWLAYAAAPSAWLFAALSAYWAAGGMVGLDTQGHAIKELAPRHEPGFVALLWATALAKLLGGWVALALAQPLGRPLPRRLLRVLAWLGGVGLTLYGGLPLIVNGLMVAGLLPVSGPVDWTAIRWHLVLWDPWWLLGGLLFLATAWSSGQPGRGG